ncbi:hypothetical protein E2C01_084511 [Portunus trituberculatus]|uniref:Uncharacterized protein n=1 Tax=Portunus trituberculatus TaxID=210409 RepID=A0A5B7J7R0_PORTR|nr:hypothetical protein [Portunus trituberculatus]
MPDEGNSPGFLVALCNTCVELHLWFQKVEGEHHGKTQACGGVLLQKPKVGIEIVQTVAINLLTSVDPS